MKQFPSKLNPVISFKLSVQDAIRGCRLLILPIIIIAMTHAGSASAQNSSDSTRLSFKPSNWSLGGSALWSDRDKKTKWAFEGDAIVRWLGPRDNIAWTLRAKYEIENKETKENSRLIRIRWLHDLTSLFFTVVEGDLEKDNVELFELDEDYRLLQGSAGLGIRKASKYYTGSALHAVSASGTYIALVRLL